MIYDIYTKPLEPWTSSRLKALVQMNISSLDIGNNYKSSLCRGRLLYEPLYDIYIITKEGKRILVYGQKIPRLEALVLVWTSSTPAEQPILLTLLTLALYLVDTEAYSEVFCKALYYYTNWWYSAPKIISYCSSFHDCSLDRYQNISTTTCFHGFI